MINNNFSEEKKERQEKRKSIKLIFLSIFFALTVFVLSSFVSAVNDCGAICNYWIYDYGPLCTDISQCKITSDNCIHPGYVPNVSLSGGVCNCVCSPTNYSGGCSQDYCPYTRKDTYFARNNTGAAFCSYDELCNQYNECKYNTKRCYNGATEVKMICKYSYYGAGAGIYNWRSTTDQPLTENYYPTDCSDGHDNDCDGLIDYYDPDCDSTAPSAPNDCYNSTGTNFGSNCNIETSSWVGVRFTENDNSGVVKELRYCPYSCDSIIPGVYQTTKENAQYDPTIGAPHCISGGSPCIANGSLLGRRDGGSYGTAYDTPSGTYGYQPFVPGEANSPNTVDTCEDWGSLNSGNPSRNTSIQNISIKVDEELVGSIYIGIFNVGDVITYNIYAYCQNNADYVHIYYKNSLGANWSSIRSQQCSGSGIRSFSGTITLTGSPGTHAIRAVIYPSATAASCPTWSESDVDDLAFDVKQYGLGSTSGNPCIPNGNPCTPAIQVCRYEYGQPSCYFEDLRYSSSTRVYYFAKDRAGNTVTGNFDITITAPQVPVQPWLVIRKGTNDVAKIGNNGVMDITGNVTTGWSGSPAPNGNDFILRNSASAVQVWIDDATGNLYLKGSLNQNVAQATLNASMSGSGNFIIKDNSGNVAAYFSNTGSLYLRGTLV